MGPDTRPDAAAPAEAVRRELSVLQRILRRHGRALLLAFFCIALPLWTFGELAEEVLEGEPFSFDRPLLEWARQAAHPRWDAIFLTLSAFGYGWGVIPADILLALALPLRRRFREAAFAIVAIGGSAMLNLAAKHGFRRERPALWTSLAPESTYSFPSGHAMGSATLAAVVVLLCWRSRFRWAVLAGAGLFVVGVGASRVYLGVHYPSDIAAGWAAAVLWTGVTYLLVLERPWTGGSGPAGAR